MNFSCNIKVVDMMMGSGKTSAAINYMNNATRKNRFMFITPYLKEVERIKIACPKLNFQSPKIIGTKLKGIKQLIRKKENIVSTHALFKHFDEETINILKARNYILIIDEVADVIAQHEICSQDFRVMCSELVNIEQKTGKLTWRKEKQNYTGKFEVEKNLCHFGRLYSYSGCGAMWMLPVEIFSSFKEIYILTYMFDAQIQKYYYDFYKIPYQYIYVKGNSQENYSFTPNKHENSEKHLDYRQLIHILNDNKMNSIGDGTYDLSKNWYIRNANSIKMIQLKNNLTNYFRNIMKSKSADNLWTTFLSYKGKLASGGYSKGFTALNTRGSNDYRSRTVIAYPVNRYLNTAIKNFFLQRGIPIDEDQFALSEMLQFIWRSAIRDGQEIWCYIPSRRMRSLFEHWITENSTSN